MYCTVAVYRSRNESKFVFIESINGIHSTKHTKHTFRSLQSTDYRRSSYDTTYALRKTKRERETHVCYQQSRCDIIQYRTYRRYRNGDMRK